MKLVGIMVTDRLSMFVSTLFFGFLAVCEQIFKLVTIEWTSSTLGVINLR